MRWHENFRTDFSRTLNCTSGEREKQTEIESEISEDISYSRAAKVKFDRLSLLRYDYEANELKSN